MHIKAFNAAAVKKLAVTYFNARQSTAKAISITALLQFYKQNSRNASFPQLLSMEANIQQLEIALVRCRASSHFETSEYIAALAQFRNNPTLLQGYALSLLEACTEAQ